MRAFPSGPKAGAWERTFKHLAEDADNECAMIDSTSYQHSVGAKKGLMLWIIRRPHASRSEATRTARFRRERARRS